jgi:hypothetical protein
MFIIFYDGVTHYLKLFFHRLNSLKLLRFENWVYLRLQVNRIENKTYSFGPLGSIVLPRGKVEKGSLTL